MYDIIWLLSASEFFLKAIRLLFLNLIKVITVIPFLAVLHTIRFIWFCWQHAMVWIRSASEWGLQLLLQAEGIELQLMNQMEIQWEHDLF